MVYFQRVSKLSEQQTYPKRKTAEIRENPVMTKPVKITFVTNTPLSERFICVTKRQQLSKVFENLVCFAILVLLVPRVFQNTRTNTY